MATYEETIHEITETINNKDNDNKEDKSRQNLQAAQAEKPENSSKSSHGNEEPSNRINNSIDDSKNVFGNSSEVTPKPWPWRKISDEVLDPVELGVAEDKCKFLANLVTLKMLGRYVKCKDEIDETLLRCIKMMMTKHNLYFKNIARRIDFNIEDGQDCFTAVADELFEGKRKIVNWGRVITLYCFAGQIALYCKEKKSEQYAITLSDHVGEYASKVISPFIVREGGWIAICKEYPKEVNLEDTAWNTLLWAAVGLSIVTLALYVTQHR